MRSFARCFLAKLQYPRALIISLNFALLQRNLGGAGKEIANIYLIISPFLKILKIFA